MYIQYNVVTCRIDKNGGYQEGKLCLKEGRDSAKRKISEKESRKPCMYVPYVCTYRLTKGRNGGKVQIWIQDAAGAALT